MDAEIQMQKHSWMEKLQCIKTKFNEENLPKKPKCMLASAAHIPKLEQFKADCPRMMCWLVLCKLYTS